MSRLLRNSRTTDSLRPGRMGEFLARWRRACAACTLFRNTRRTEPRRDRALRVLRSLVARAAPCALLTCLLLAAVPVFGQQQKIDLGSARQLIDSGRFIRVRE